MRWWDWFGDGSLVVGSLGLACCQVEVDAATAGRAATTAPPPGAQIVLLVTGTVTDAVAGLVARAKDDLGAGFVVAFGACACAGGPYWDSPVVTNGAGQILDVALHVPGCPPDPGALDEALAGLRARAHA